MEKLLCKHLGWCLVISLPRRRSKDLTAVLQIKRLKVQTCSELKSVFAAATGNGARTASLAGSDALGLCFRGGGLCFPVIL